VLKAKIDFMRPDLLYVPQHIQQWLVNVQVIRSHIFELWERHPNDPAQWAMNLERCDDYGNCEFQDVHYTPPIKDTQIMIMQEGYVEDRWDPLNLDEVQA